ncbi:hypothetical protein DFP72DRAFT_1077725 [Ephemerocybe angulata]|uniref:F-box domain-containing protein n=1 Tax=Ephemerocybe angulata TaxID=980116 RepID=A0A8H6HCJ1_9AGAR|nr:hypothetical protein DFP72DRAFT_859049 [Tulosesus angulatus]KAF6745287.1 hypothetical protein DFP72DRAFT_1077725 [Tulosesus angulatus]
MDNVPYELLEKIVALYIEDLCPIPRRVTLPIDLALVDQRTLLAATRVSWRSILVDSPRYAERLLEKAANILGGKRLGEETRRLHIHSRSRPPEWHCLPDVLRAFPNLNTLSINFRHLTRGLVPRPWAPLGAAMLPYPAGLTHLQLDEAPSVDEVAALSASLPSLQFLGVHRVTSQSPPTTTTLHFPALTHLALGDHTFYHPRKEYGVLMAAFAVGGLMPKLEALELLHYAGDPRPLLARFGKQLKFLSYPTRPDDEGFLSQATPYDYDEEEVPLDLCPNIRTLRLFFHATIVHGDHRQRSMRVEIVTINIVTPGGGKMTGGGERASSEEASRRYEQVHRVCRMEGHSLEIVAYRGVWKDICIIRK